MNLQELRKEGAIKRYNIAAKNTYEVLAHNNDMDELEKEQKCLQKTYVEAAEEIRKADIKMDHERYSTYDRRTKEVET